MRSNLITVATAVASMVLVAQVAAADQVQEQFRLMEQRMAEMEDRLEATSSELAQAQATVETQQNLLSEAGLADDEGLLSGVGSFFELVDISGVAAASFNYRLIDSDINANLPGGNPFFRTPNSNTFQLDQIWLTLDKAPTEESRGGFHAEIIAGEAAQAQVGFGGSGTANAAGVNEGVTDDGLGIYSAYVSYLAPIGNGVQFDLGKLATPLGAEVVQTNGNYFITQGAVFGLQPVTHTGISATTQLTDSIGFTAGIVNDVYDDTATSFDQDKAYYAQLQFAGEGFGVNVGAIYGNTGGATEAETSVFDVTITADPTENLSLWVNYDWVHTDGSNGTTGSGHGDAHGISAAGRLAVTDTMGVATRVEYINGEKTLAGTADDSELVTLTGTVDKTLAEGLVARLELRWDTCIEGGDVCGFTTRSDDGAATHNDNLAALFQMYYEF